MYNYESDLNSSINQRLSESGHRNKFRSKRNHSKIFNYEQQGFPATKRMKPNPLNSNFIQHTTENENSRYDSKFIDFFANQPAEKSNDQSKIFLYFGR